MWYGLVVDGILVSVKWFRAQPTQFDFNAGVYDSRQSYRVVTVGVAITGQCEQAC